MVPFLKRTKVPRLSRRVSETTLTITPVYLEKGWRSRTYYRLAEDGKRALLEVQDYQRSLWEGVSEVVLDLKESR